MVSALKDIQKIPALEISGILKGFLDQALLCISKTTLTEMF